LTFQTGSRHSQLNIQTILFGVFYRWEKEFIQKSISIATNDYMPFGTNAVEIMMVFALLNVIYWLVQSTFRLGVSRAIKKGEVTALIHAE
jgi:hypothetical protein